MYFAEALRENLAPAIRRHAKANESRPASLAAIYSVQPPFGMRELRRQGNCFALKNTDFRRIFGFEMGFLFHLFFLAKEVARRLHVGRHFPNRASTLDRLPSQATGSRFAAPN